MLEFIKEFKTKKRCYSYIKSTKRDIIKELEKGKEGMYFKNNSILFYDLDSISDAFVKIRELGESKTDTVKASDHYRFKDRAWRTFGELHRGVEKFEYYVCSDDDRPYIKTFPTSYTSRKV